MFKEVALSCFSC